MEYTEIVEALKELSVEQLVELKKAIEEELANRAGNEWVQRLAQKVPFFAERLNKIKFVAENGKWVYFDVDVSRAELQDVKHVVSSAGLACFVRANAYIFVGGRRIFVSRLLGVLKSQLTKESEE